jgi:serine/threonine protein kinase
VPRSDESLTKLCGTCGYRLEAGLQRCPTDGARLPRERPEVAVLGSYRLVQRLGSGGMGVVYRAVHQKLGRPVAIKVLNRSLLADRTNVARFFQEARSVNTIRHPNVVDIYDFVTAGRDIYTVMELLVGQDLHHAIYTEGRPFTPERAVAILVQICAGLQAAHDRNIIHRDLKPANVFLTRRGSSDDEFVKLLDFGLAKLERAEGRMTREGVVLGTPEYMAPEQARGAPLDCRADIYGVGCLAFHMLTGCQLFAGGSYAEVMVRHVKEPAPSLRRLNSSLPEALERVVLRALAKDPAARPPSSRAMAEELAAAVDRPLESFVTVPGRPRSVSTAPVEEAPSASYSTIFTRSLVLEGRSRLPMVLGVLALAVVGSALWVRGHRHPGAIAAPVTVERPPPEPALVEPAPLAPVSPDPALLGVADPPLERPTARPPTSRRPAAPPGPALRRRRSVRRAPADGDAGFVDSRARTINPFAP